MRHVSNLPNMFCSCPKLIRCHKWSGQSIDWWYFFFERNFLWFLHVRRLSYVPGGHNSYWGCSYPGFHWGWHCRQPRGEARRQHADQWVRLAFEYNQNIEFMIWLLLFYWGGLNPKLASFVISWWAQFMLRSFMKRHKSLLFANPPWGFHLSWLLFHSSPFWLVSLYYNFLLYAFLKF